MNFWKQLVYDLDSHRIDVQGVALGGSYDFERIIKLTGLLNEAMWRAQELANLDDLRGVPHSEKEA